MKLTLQIKLLPTKEQFTSLKNTLIEANTVCNVISDICWEKSIYNQYGIHNEVYYNIKSSYKLSSQMIIRCISKVSDSYKLDKKTKRSFNVLGAITYDSRILSYKEDTVSICSIDGRLKNIKFICHNNKYLPFIKGEADLVLNKGKFYLFQTVELEDKEVEDVEEFIGCDFGLSDICTLSDGDSFSSLNIKKVRKKYSKVRASVQRKGTKGAKKLLKRLSGREHRFATISNHTISKIIVSKAKEQNKGISIEDLTNIRFTSKFRSRSNKVELNRWSFLQLRQFITYKCIINGVKLSIIPPAYTSKTCSNCMHIGNRVAKRFTCENCGNKSDADVNAAKNIATWGYSINYPERDNKLKCDLLFLNLL